MSHGWQSEPTDGSKSGWRQLSVVADVVVMVVVVGLIVVVIVDVVVVVVLVLVFASGGKTAPAFCTFLLTGTCAV